jgi:hypothetical protein
VAVVEADAFFEDWFGGAGFAAGAVDVFAGFRGAVGGHLPGFDGGVFDHNDAVGAFGERGASHDADGLAGLEPAGEGFAGADFADDVEGAGEVGGAAGEAVADGAVCGGIVAVGEDVLGEDAAGGLREGDGLDGRPGRGGGDGFDDKAAGGEEFQSLLMDLHEDRITAVLRMEE